MQPRFLTLVAVVATTLTVGSATAFAAEPPNQHGPFNSAMGHYRDNVILTAVPA